MGNESGRGAPEASSANNSACATIDIGILTKGKPTLSMALASLLLQELRDIRIHIVDTSDSPVIKRDDVMYALRLGFDRGISCGYQHLKSKGRAFSEGRLKLLEALDGRNICFMDDDIVMASSTLPQMLPFICSGQTYGYIAPYCVNATPIGGVLSDVPHFSPGGIFCQDAVVRKILLEYYSSTVDILDEKKSKEKVWEVAFLSELFSLLGRECLVQSDHVAYHLDYRERPNNWDWDESRLVNNSVLKARELLSKFNPSCSGQAVNRAWVPDGA
ncbi:MAG: hypothetical protein M1358_20415 [Chloroflexi bacterium]|nr:hypothetical protein [Chloroflexota bacterium]